MPAEEQLRKEVRFDERFCWTNKANFTFGLADQLYVQFKTDRRFKARSGQLCTWSKLEDCFRGFNCTVTCEEFDFSNLFAKDPIPHPEVEEILEYEDDKEEAEEEDEDYEDDE